MHHDRIKSMPKKDTLMDAHSIMEMYDPGMKALPFDSSTNYHGVGTFINDILTKLKNIKVHGTNEGGKVDKAGTDSVGDGKIFVSSLDEVIRIRTGETGSEAI